MTTHQVCAWVTGKELPTLLLSHQYGNHFLIVESLEAGYVAGQEVIAEVDAVSGRLTIVEYLL